MSVSKGFLRAIPAALILWTLLPACSVREGIPLPDYRWVESTAHQGPPARGASGVFPLGVSGAPSPGFHLMTPDGQLMIEVPHDALPPRIGEAFVRVTLTPLD